MTTHELRVGRTKLDYTATAGFLPIKHAKGETEARLFFMAYTLDAPKHDRPRPLMVSFNGESVSNSRRHLVDDLIAIR